ncbi:MAG: hypothetical protein LLF99_08450 [Desulfobacteraceae bacterium]|nr:hypothetical protein [Desulfobacteraceae bacterium]
MKDVEKITPAALNPGIDWNKWPGRVPSLSPGRLPVRVKREGDLRFRIAGRNIGL